MIILFFNALPDPLFAHKLHNKHRNRSAHYRRDIRVIRRGTTNAKVSLNFFICSSKPRSNI